MTSTTRSSNVLQPQFEAKMSSDVTNCHLVSQRLSGKGIRLPEAGDSKIPESGRALGEEMANALSDHWLKSHDSEPLSGGLSPVVLGSQA